MTCGKTEVPTNANVPGPELHAGIVRVQQLHAHRHATERAAGAR